MADVKEFARFFAYIFGRLFSSPPNLEGPGRGLRFYKKL